MSSAQNKTSHLSKLELRIATLEARIAELEKIFKPMGNGEPPDHLVVRDRVKEYQPLFDRWTPNGR